MYILKNKDGAIIASSEIPVDGFEETNIEYGYTFDGKIKPLAEMQGAAYKAKVKEYEEKLRKDDLRSRRELECFSIINRGTLWYDRLTESQKTELESWYEAWLNVTDTNVVPPKPAWIEGVAIQGGNT